MNVLPTASDTVNPAQLQEIRVGQATIGKPE